MLRKPIEAALFDMDGLLIDTEAVYVKALQAAAQSLGLEMPLAFCHSMVGIPGKECDVMIQNFYGEGFRIDEFRMRFSGHATSLLEANIPVKPGVIELLDFLAAHALPLAVATSAGRATAERHLGRAGLLDRRRSRHATMSCTPSPPPTSTWRRRAVLESRPNAVSPSRIRMSA